MMSTSSWERHANPWSVYTRLATVPLAALTAWSRLWIGEWAWLPAILIVAWLWLNVRVFPPVKIPTAWASKAIFGERLWLEGGSLTGTQRSTNRVLVGLGGVSMLALVYGAIRLSLIPVVLGCTGVIAAQLLRLALFARLYDQSCAHKASASPTLG